MYRYLKFNNMSRICQAPIDVHTGVDVSNNGDVVTVKGKLGELTQELSGGITVSMEENIITVQRPSESKEHKAKHGFIPCANQQHGPRS